MNVIGLIVCAALASRAVAKEPRTLAFVFDVTFSMVSDLEHLKLGIQQIFKDVTATLDERYSHYLFLGFHDPVIGLPYVTDNKTELLEALKGVYAFPLSLNNDCEEQCLPALYHVLYSVHETSDILVFTDDNSKGDQAMPLIMDLVELLHPRISFIISPGCNFGNLDENYEKLANHTGGQIYEIVKRNVSSLMHGLSVQLGSDWAMLATSYFHVGGIHEVPVLVERKDRLLVSLTGHGVSLRILNPRREEVTGTATIDMQNSKEVVVEKPVSGRWVVEVSGKGTHRLRVMADGEAALAKSMLGIFVSYCVAFGLVIGFCLWQYRWFWEQCKNLWTRVRTREIWCLRKTGDC